MVKFLQIVRFEIPTAVIMKILWDVTPRGLVQIYRRFDATYGLHLQSKCRQYIPLSTSLHCVTLQQVIRCFKMLHQADSHMNY
jgi:hypothetical protein